MTTILRLHFVTVYVVSCLRTFLPVLFNQRRSPPLRLPVLCVMFLVQPSFVVNLLNVFPVRLQIFLLTFCYHSGGSMHYRYNYTFHVPHSLCFVHVLPYLIYFLLPRTCLCHSGRCPPKLFLVFPLYSSSRAKYRTTFWDYNCIRVTGQFLDNYLSRYVQLMWIYLAQFTWKSINHIVQNVTFVSKATWNI